VDAGTHPYISTGLKSNKFGIPHEHALGLYQTAAQLPGVAIVGLDCHIGSQITQIAPYVDALDRVLDLVDALQAHGIALKHLDLGGGLGIRYRDEAPPSPHDLVQALLARLKARGHGHLEVAVEPGRSLVGPAGWLLMRVLGLKMGETRSFCVVDAGMNDMMRPALYDAWMDIQVLSPHPPESAPAPAVYDVVGPVCETGDWLGRDRALAVAPGDVLCLHGAGAYGMSMASNYNSRPHPAQFMRRADGQWHCISPRQSVQALWAQEQVLPPSA
jgi:diaminopimelate decarboxylase